MRERERERQYVFEYLVIVKANALEVVQEWKYFNYDFCSELKEDKLRFNLANTTIILQYRSMVNF